MYYKNGQDFLFIVNSQGEKNMSSNTGCLFIGLGILTGIPGALLSMSIIGLPIGFPLLLITIVFISLGVGITKDKQRKQIAQMSRDAQKIRKWQQT